MDSAVRVSADEAPLKRTSESSLGERLGAAPHWVLLLLGVGLLFRCGRLEHKLFWLDEVYTGIRVSGHTAETLYDDLLDGRVVSADDLSEYQRAHPNRPVILEHLMVEDAIHPNPYFVCLRQWMLWFGSSVAAMRGFSVVASLLSFVSLYWLASELFQHDEGRESEEAAVVVGLVAVSPIHLVLAQQARPYAPWMALSLAASAALLVAMRNGKTQNWFVYCGLMIASLYTHALSLPLALGHTVYVFGCERFRPTPRLRSFVVVGLACVVAFMPWFNAILNGRSRNEEIGLGTQAISNVGLWEALAKWAGILSRGFVDFGANPASSREFRLVMIPLIAPLLLFMTYCAYRCLRETPTRVWLFLASMTMPTVAALLIIWAALDHQIATTRYCLLVILGMELTVAWFLADRLRSDDPPTYGRARLTLSTLVGLGILSCALRTSLPIWWDQVPIKNKHTLETVSAINHASQPLVITDADDSNLKFLLTVNHKLTCEPKYLFVPASQTLEQAIQPGGNDLRDNVDSVFLARGSDRLQEEFQEMFDALAQRKNEELWACDLSPVK